MNEIYWFNLSIRYYFINQIQETNVIENFYER